MFPSLEPDVTKQEFVNSEVDPRWWESGEGSEGHRGLWGLRQEMALCLSQVLCFSASVSDPSLDLAAEAEWERVSVVSDLQAHT